MQSKATTVEQYLAELPPDRQHAMRVVRGVILENLPPGYEEGMQYGMIGYYVPHSIFPAGYHCDPKQPLGFAGLGSRKGYMSLYLMPVYGDAEHAAWFRKAWALTGKKLDMGKACIRFKRVEDVPLEVIGEAIRRVPVKAFVARYQEALRSQQQQRPAARRRAAPKTAPQGADRRKSPARAEARRPVRKSAAKRAR